MSETLFYRKKKTAGSFWIVLVFLIFSTFYSSAQEKKGDIVLLWNTPWIIAENQPEAFTRAIADVERDWYKIFGHRPIILHGLPKSWTGPAIYFGVGDNTPNSVLNEGSFDGAESFWLGVRKDEENRNVLVASGADLRGSIYAAYTFSEKILGVDPWYFWVDKEPLPQKSISVPMSFDLKFGAPTFKYRGWFINDEDQLSMFSKDPMKENVISLEMYDKIYETLLRLKGNMVVPSTFLFPDERSQELAARRGLILNMHHILVLGLNTYRWPDSIPFSYNKHPEIMEKYWKTCIDAYKDYETIWTVGYRGKHDRPFWYDDPDLKTPEEQGAVISNAIAKQVEMIRKVHPKAPIITNLWDEGAEMYRAGYIKIPEDITIVWPDNGAGIIRDRKNVQIPTGFFRFVVENPTNLLANAPGRVKSGQGIYYHTAMLNGHANQLTEMVDPARIYMEIGRFVDTGATEFFLVNVSDIRPVPLSTDCVMDLVWNAEPYKGKTAEQNSANFLADWSERQ